MRKKCLLSQLNIKRHRVKVEMHVSNPIFQGQVIDEKTANFNSLGTWGGLKKMSNKRSKHLSRIHSTRLETCLGYMQHKTRNLSMDTCSTRLETCLGYMQHKTRNLSRIHSTRLETCLGYMQHKTRNLSRIHAAQDSKLV